MGKVLRGIALGLGALLLLLVLVGVLARFSDGPLGPFPGGPLVEGRLVEGPVGDWAFVEAVPEIELQLLEPPRSRRTWILFHEGSAYIPCGFLDLPLWKRWPHEAQADGRGIVRIDGKRYRVRLARVDDPALEEALTAELKAKYPSAGDYSGETWFFRLDPPAARRALSSAPPRSRHPALLVVYPSRASFIDMVTSPEHLDANLDRANGLGKHVILASRTLLSQPFPPE
jgi:hypothetical protein